MRPNALRFLLALLLAGLVHAAPKNIVLFIADGGGFNQVRAADLWDGANQPYEDFPVRLAMSTYSRNGLEQDSTGYDPKRAWADFSYVMEHAGESAGSASAMATGVKGRDGQLAVDPETGAALETFFQRAERMGKSNGVVTTTTWSHATPAAFASHDLSRKHVREIVRGMLDSSGCEVIMGCGNPCFDLEGKPVTPDSTKDFEDVGGPEMWAGLVEGRAGGDVPLTLIQTRSEFQNLAAGPTPNRVCGTAETRETLQDLREPREKADEFVSPYTVPMIETVPSLAEMVRAALNVLDNNPRGFVVMIEAGAVDWAGHDHQLGRLIEEMDALSQAVGAVTEWVEIHGGWDSTLVIVTCDHETGYLWGPESGEPAKFQALVDNGAHHLPGAHFFKNGHTNSLVPFYARGAGAERFTKCAMREDSVRGPYLDNTDIGKVILGLLVEESDSAR